MKAVSGDAGAQRANSASASASAVCSPLRTASAALLALSSTNSTISSPSAQLRPSRPMIKKAYRRNCADHTAVLHAAPAADLVPQPRRSSDHRGTPVGFDPAFEGD